MSLRATRRPFAGVPSAREVARAHRAAFEAMASGAARAIYVEAWSERERACGRTYPGQDLLAVAPATSRAALREGRRFVRELELRSYASAPGLAERAWRAEGWDDLPTVAFTEELGRLLVMQALGTGVSWTDDHRPFLVDIPRFEARL